MAKSLQKNRAIDLRKKGESIKQIAEKVSVSKGTVSLWCRDIVLSVEQIENLRQRMVSLGHIGRVKGARMQYERRLKRIEGENKRGIETIGKLSDRELLIAFVSLYWGEGCKKNRRLEINNSDPEMIKFLMMALRRIFKIKKDEFVFNVGINKIHKTRDEEIKNYWSDLLRIPREQFRKTIFIKAKNKKIYKNFLNHYGTLTIRIKKSSGIFYQVMGLIMGLRAGAKE